MNATLVIKQSIQLQQQNYNLHSKMNATLVIK